MLSGNELEGDLRHADTMLSAGTVTMLIDRSWTLAGLRVQEVRNLLRTLRCYGLGGFGVEAVMHLQRCDEAEAEHIVAALVDEQLIMSTDAGWMTSRAGNRLAAARLCKRLKRKTAERLMGEFMDRVVALAEDDGYLYRVDRVLVFGSYLTDAPTLGDIDLAFDLVRRELDGERFDALARERANEAERNGRRFNSWCDWFSWPRDEVMRFLRSRSRYLSFHPLDEPEALGCPVREVYARNDG